MKAWKLVLAAVLAFAFSTPSMAQDEKKGKRGGNQPTPEETFKKMDANGDGKVTKDELEKWVKGNDRLAKRAEQDAEFVSKMFTSMDGNKDGNVTLEEYKKYRDEANAKRKKKDPS